MRAHDLIEGGPIRLAKKALFTSTMWFGIAALVVATATLPADAQSKRKSAAKQVENPIPDPANGQPMTLVVSLNQQKIDIYRGTTHVTTAGVSTGMRGYATKAGVFSIMEKKRHHRSNLYSGAPMPWMQRLTWSGTALHAGVLPGYPASHGCIRLPFSFAPKLFAITTKGDNVVVARDRVAPTVIEHPALFQPLPQPSPPIMAKEEPPQRQSSIEAPFGVANHPVILARAEVSGITTDVPASMEMTPDRNSSAISHAAESEDTRVHAIDPFVVATAEAVTNHAFATSSETPLEITASEEARTAMVEAAVAETAPMAEENVPQASAVATVIPAVAIAPATVETPSTPAPILSPIAIKLGAGTKAAAIEAAEPRSMAPLRILVTRRTQRDRIMHMQNTLAELGHLEAQDFDGTVGRTTANAIKSFQKEQGLPETGTFSEDLMKKIYEVAGKEVPPVGHLYLRQEFGRVFDTPVNFRNPEEPLGTHLFTAMKFAPDDDTKTKWMAISVMGDDSSAALDRLEISDDLRRKISERLTPGSSFIIGDVAINSANLPKGADFVVWTKETGVQRASVSPDASARPRKKRQQATRRQNNIFGFQPRRYQPRNQGWPW
ncbi:MAG TPA: L,D-transpeptidase family protein [Methyloceanibacter sp.]|nr:L,D-transpeptidase family protein [Methyloceanibacter sp.]